MEEVKNIRSDTGKDREKTILEIIFPGTDHHEHQGDGERLKGDRAERNILVLFQRLIEPFHPDQVKEERDPADQEKRPVVLKLWNKGETEGENQADEQGHRCIDQEDLLNCLRKFFFIITDTGAGADPVGGNSQRRCHRKIRHHRHSKGNASGAIWKQDPGHIGIGDQRKDQRGRSQQDIHNKVFSKRCLHSHNRFLLFDIHQYNIVEWGCPWN